MASIAADSV